VSLLILSIIMEYEQSRARPFKKMGSTCCKKNKLFLN